MIKGPLINVIYNRLLRDIAQGKPLEGVKMVRVGFIEQARTLSDYPVIFIQPMSGTDSPANPNLEQRDAINVRIWIVANRLSGENSMFDDLGNGILNLQEKVLNSIDTANDGSTDNKLDGNVSSIISRRYEFILGAQDLVECVIELSAETKEFIIGGR